jgi:hypothetical protein
MKKYIKYITQLALAGVILCLALWACSDMNELSDRFMTKGETVYAAKVDSAVTHGGYKKVEVEFYIRTLRIDTVKVYWNDFQRVSDVVVSNRSGVFSTVIEELNESAYIFQLVSIDSYGNKSLPVEVSGEAFGDNRLSLLRSRNITSAVYNNTTNEVTIKWGAAVENSSGCLLTYTNTDGQTATLHVPPDETTTTIPAGFKSGLYFVTQFLLGEGSVAETVSTDAVSQGVWREILPKSGWSAIASSYHDNPRQPSAAIDGNPNQPWHSCAGCSERGMPQWIQIDFGAGNALPIDGIVYQPRIDDINDKSFPKRVLWESSNDASAWTTVREDYNLDYPISNSPNPQWLPCTVPTVARYLKCTIHEAWPTNRAYTYIGELGIFEIVE